MAKYVNIDELVAKINEEQEKLKNDNDKIWKINKPYFDALAMVHAMIRECEDVISINKSLYDLEDYMNISIH